MALVLPELPGSVIQRIGRPELPGAWRTLYSNAINGFTGNTGIMPPKGGFTGLSDDQVKVIVDYMVVGQQ